MSKTNHAKIVGEIVESSVLFDCTVRHWIIAEIT